MDDPFHTVELTNDCIQTVFNKGQCFGSYLVFVVDPFLVIHLKKLIEDHDPFVGNRGFHLQFNDRGSIGNGGCLDRSNDTRSRRRHGIENNKIILANQVTVILRVDDRLVSRISYRHISVERHFLSGNADEFLFPVDVKIITANSKVAVFIGRNENHRRIDAEQFLLLHFAFIVNRGVQVHRFHHFLHQ